MAEERDLSSIEVWSVDVPAGADREVQALGAMHTLLELSLGDYAAQRRVLDWLVARVDADAARALQEGSGRCHG